MEYIILQPLQTKNASINVSIVERKVNITPEEEKLILHEAGGAYSGFIVKKILPLNYQPSLYTSEKGDSSFKLNVFMRHATNPEMQQASEMRLKHIFSKLKYELIFRKCFKEQRIIYFWFSTQSEKERHTITTSFFHNLYKGDGFPKDYFEFLLKVMQIIKVLKQVRQLKIEFQQIGEPQPLNPPSNHKIIFKLSFDYFTVESPFLSRGHDYIVTIP